MVKHTGPMIVACLYLLLSAWLVGSAGKMHRQSLMEARREPPRPPKVASPERTSKGVSQPETRPIAENASVTESKTAGPPIVAKPLSTSPSPRELEKPATPPSIAVAKPTAKEAVLAPTVPDVATKAGPPKLGRINAFFDSPIATKKWDVEGWTTEKESELGHELNAMVLRFNRRSSVGALERRVVEAADPILEACTRKEVKYNFFVLDSDAVNAFSHPGGYVYVTRGLLNWISEDENEALQFALAHEICHVDRGHALACLHDANLRKLPYGTLTIFYLFIFPRAYPDAMEFTADHWALMQLRRLGYTRRMSLKFINKLDHYAEDHEFLQGRAYPEPERVSSLFDNHYRAHPAARDRAKRLLAEFDDSQQKKK